MGSVFYIPRKSRSFALLVGGRKPGLARGGAGFRPVVVVFKDERGGQFIRKQVQGAGIVSVFGHALPAMGG